MSDKNVVVSVVDLIKDYGLFRAVNNIRFDVFEGEIFGLLGPNGAGKTTTLEIMETLRKKTSGHVSVCGFSVDEQPESIKRNIGVQLQEAGYYPNLKLVEILDMFAGLYNVTVNPIEILAKVDLKEKAKSRVDKLSGGQKQRFSIATTLINKPKLIFLDEPTVGLDPQARRNLWELIKQIRSEGTTVIITTHYLDEAEILCDRVGIMDEGKIIALDTPDKLIQHLIDSGFKRETIVREATLEDVFLNLTGKNLREA